MKGWKRRTWTILFIHLCLDTQMMMTVVGRKNSKKLSLHPYSSSSSSQTQNPGRLTVYNFRPPSYFKSLNPDNQDGDDDGMNPDYNNDNDDEPQRDIPETGRRSPGGGPEYDDVDEGNFDDEEAPPLRAAPPFVPRRRKESPVILLKPPWKKPKTNQPSYGGGRGRRRNDRQNWAEQDTSSSEEEGEGMVERESEEKYFDRDLDSGPKYSAEVIRQNKAGHSEVEKRTQKPQVVTKTMYRPPIQKAREKSTTTTTTTTTRRPKIFKRKPVIHRLKNPEFDEDEEEDDDSSGDDSESEKNVLTRWSLGPQEGFSVSEEQTDVVSTFGPVWPPDIGLRGRPKSPRQPPLYVPLHARGVNPQTRHPYWNWTGNFATAVLSA